MKVVLQSLLAWLTVTEAIGQPVDSLRRVLAQTEQQQPSARREVLLYRNCMALGQAYRWGKQQAPANIDSAIFFIGQAVGRATSPRLRADALRLRGDLYTQNELGFTASWMGFDDLNEAGTIYIHLRDAEGLHQTYNTLSVLYLNHYSIQSLTSANTLRYRTMALRVQSDPSFVWPKQVKAPTADSAASPALFREAIRAGEQNLAVWIQRGSKPHRMWRLEYLGGLYRQSGIDPPKGKLYLQQAVGLAGELGDYFFQFPCLTNLAHWELDDKNYAASLRYARQGLALAYQQRYQFRQAAFHDRLYYTFRAMGQLDSAYAHKDASIIILDSLSRVGDQRQIQYLKEKYIAGKHQHELEQALTQQHNLLYLLAGLGLILLTATGMFIWRNRMLLRRNEQLQTAILQGQTTERQRLAADLHDNLGTTLTALQWSLDATDKSKLTAAERAVYATIREQVGQAYRDVRLLSHNLLPAELAKQGLAVALQNLVAKLNRNTAVGFRLTGADALPRLDEQTEFELYSICLELLNNTIKHAQATEGSIDFRLQAGMLLMTVGDNGKGAANQPINGQGLANVAARVTSLSGTLVTHSEPGAGVENQIAVPIRLPVRASSQT